MDDTSADALILKLTIDATPPVVTTGDATGVAATKATLNGVLTDDGGAATTANVYYGTGDGGTNPAAWDNVFPAGNIEGNFAIDLLNLMPGTQFYYRYLAFNAAAQTGVWSDQTKNFTTTASLVPVVGGSIGNLSTDGTVFDVELKSDLVYIGTGTVSNGASASLTKDSIPGMVLWLDANKTGTVSKEQGSKVYNGNQVTAYQNLVAYWTFEEGEGTSTKDVSNNGNDAKFFGNPAFTADNAGKFGRAIDFDHNGDYLKVSHFAGVTTSNFVSASAWVKLDTLGSGGADDSAIIGSHANDGHMFLLWYNEDGAGANPSYSFNVGSTATGTNRVGSGAGSAVANTWQHVVGTYNMGTKKIYVNGVLKGTVSNSTTQISPVGQDFYIGAWDGSYQQYADEWIYR